jgi:AcrR family transcriptional regulator
MSATLACSGELGVKRTRVADVIARYGGHRVQFYEHFANLAESYAAAHAAEAERLERRVLAAGAAAGSWAEGLQAALLEAARFAAEDREVARGLIVEVHVAGEPAIGRHREVRKRLVRAVDSARRGTRSRHSPPPLTAHFMVGAIEAAVVRALMRDEAEALERVLPQFVPLIDSAYL